MDASALHADAASQPATLQLASWLSPVHFLGQSALNPFKCPIDNVLDRLVKEKG